MPREVYQDFGQGGAKFDAGISGLVASGAQRLPRLYDSFSGQFGEALLQESQFFTRIQVVEDYSLFSGRNAFGDETVWTTILYHRASDSTTYINDYVEAANAVGELAIATKADLNLWPSGEKILLPTTIGGEGIGSAYVSDLSRSGWVTGGLLLASGKQVGYVANMHSGEFRDLPYPGQLVNDHGQAVLTRSGEFISATPWKFNFWDGEALTERQAQLGFKSPYLGTEISFNNHGQIVHALELDDDGRIVQVAVNPDDGDPFVESWKVVIGLPLLISGDYDASGSVAQADLDVVLSAWGLDARPTAWVHDTGFFDVDGRVEQSDLDRVLLRWGATDGVPVVGSVSTESLGVPEPTAIVLASMVMTCGLLSASAKKWKLSTLRVPTTC
jgi:hypothetical protein